MYRLRLNNIGLKLGGNRIFPFYWLFTDLRGFIMSLLPRPRIRNNITN